MILKLLKKSGFFSFVKYEKNQKFHSVAPTDLKFVTCAEDKVLKIWDLERKVIESEKIGWQINNLKFNFL